MCKDGSCGHFNDGLQGRWDLTAKLEPVLVTGEKLQLAIDAELALDRVRQTLAEERESATSKLAAEVTPKLKAAAKAGHTTADLIADGIRVVEDMAQRQKKVEDAAFHDYMVGLDKAVEGTVLEGLHVQSEKEEKALVQHDLTYAKALSFGVFHRNPDAVLGRDGDAPFTLGEVPEDIHDIGRKIAEALGSDLVGIVAVPKRD